MMNKKLVKYVQSTLHQGYSAAQVTEHLRKAGYPEQDIENALFDAARAHQRRYRLIIALTGLIAFIALGIILYFIFISPAFVEKPFVAQPALLSQQVEAGTAVQAPGLSEIPELVSAAVQLVGAEHIRYVLNELGAYKLHANPFTGDLPEIEIYVRDLQKTFTAIIDDNEVMVAEAVSQSPDARVEVMQDAFVSLSTAEGEQEFQKRAAQLLSEREQRGYKGMLLTSEQDLVLKGYVALYQEQEEVIQGSGSTGSVILELPLHSTALIGMFVMVAMLWGLLLVRLSLDR
jgi:hypothetical protein